MNQKLKLWFESLSDETKEKILTNALIENLPVPNKVENGNGIKKRGRPKKNPSPSPEQERILKRIEASDPLAPHI
jgi:hypothetical protein